MNPFQLPEQLNLAQVFLHAQAATHPQRPAIYFEDQVITLGQLSDATHRASTVFKSLGLQWEQRVLLMLPDVPQFASAWFGAVQAGGVVSAVNPGLKADELASYLNYTRAKLVVTEGETAAAIAQVRAQCPHLEHVLVAGGHSSFGLDYDDALEKATPDASIAATHRDDACVWLYTSGSTGFPKAAVHKQHDFVFNALTYGKLLGYAPGDVGISVPRLAFGYALGTNLLFPLLTGGAAVLFKEKATPEKFFELLKKHRPTVFTAVPTALNNLLNAPGLADADFSSLRLVISAGEALPAELYQRWKQRTGVEILDGIGSAEMFHIFITNRPGDVKLGSLGRVVEGYEAKVCDEHGVELPRGEIGTLWVRGDSMALEYWQQHEKSKSTFRGDWCVSADKFQQTDDGYFYFCGRGDDMLKVGGRWLSPVEVENVLLQHPAVREAAVVSFKDQDGLDKPRAFVALHAGRAASEALAEELKAHVRGALEPYKAPREVRFVDALPRSDRGKVLKTELRG
ncbi:MAG: benzoate-CoA ligase family protein [Myxococcota bacterium]